MADVVVASGSVTKANMRISAIDGTAFVDFSAASILTSRLTHKLTLYDSALKSLVGWIKAAGTGETYDTTVIANGTFETNADSWNAQSGATLTGGVAGGQVGNCLQITRGTAQISGRQDPTLISGALYYGIIYGKNGTGTARAEFSNYSSLFSFGVDWAEQSVYFTKSVAGCNVLLEIPSANGTDAYYDEVSLKQVLTPSATGVTIVSAKGGSTFNWTSQEGGFNYNDSSGYTYTITLEGAGGGLGDLSLGMALR